MKTQKVSDKEFARTMNSALSLPDMMLWAMGIGVLLGFVLVISKALHLF